MSADERVARWQRARRAALQARLTRRRDESDRGQTLPRTAGALGRAGAARLEALVDALASERVIVAVQVEAGRAARAPLLPGEGEQHARLDRVDSPIGPALAVYTSVEQLLRADSRARPMPQAVKPLALAALAEAGGHLLVDPAGARIALPRPATAALAQGDAWLPAWRDADLAGELRRLAGGVARAVRVVPSSGAVVRVEVLVDAGERDRRRIAEALRALASSPRLAAAAERVELMPLALPEESQG